MKTITLTGNRPWELAIQHPEDKRIAIIKEAIRRKLISMIDNGLEWVIMTGQIGVELWAAEIILDLKESYPIKLGIFPPFLEYESRWPDFYQAKFQEIIEASDFYQPLYPKTYEGPYQLKNKDNWLIDKTDGACILGDEEYLGSVTFFAEKAKKAVEAGNYEILFITPFDLEDVAREMAEEN
ncbi:putative phage-like protein YoqJ [Gracilibacillus halotolerans]|uniref:Putative phage-like protein YoqJ n=1 Tax=Gracilibacillus halotolerans TaxID=74386 RepID=A0A841RHV3_9BACI|nr:SLOG family protein [Gracilibacillus halotolerans]MBB6511612.1 putative phage-like protein YoqJ [Gracilibacillus halotolerans]